MPLSLTLVVLHLGRCGALRYRRWTGIGANAKRQRLNGNFQVHERTGERTFGPGRFARTAFRIREGRAHALDLSFTARIGTLLVGSVRLTPIRIGETPALLLGPLTVEPPFRSHGVGTALVKRALKEAQASGHKLVVLVGDEPIYAKSGFKRIPKGQVKMPGPVDPARLLVAELAKGAFEGVSGLIRPDWEE
jgi:predicted N-acetyltransferase YhbS